MPASQTDKTSDVLILGAGVIGLACAYALLRAGVRCTVIDAGRVGGGSSHGNCGTLTPSHAPLTVPGQTAQALRWMMKSDAPLYIKPTMTLSRARWLLNFSRHCNARHFQHVLDSKTRLLLDSKSLLQSWVEEAGLDCEFETSGTLYAFREASAFEAGCRLSDAVRAAGVLIETWDSATIKQREPSLNDSIVGGHFHPDDGRLRPERYTAELARVIRKLGGAIHEHETVIGFETNGDQIHTVITDKQRYQPNKIILALGAWSPKISKQLGLTLPMEPGKGYSITYTCPSLAPTIPIVLKERGVCVTSWGSGFRLGSTMEFSGYDTTLNPIRIAALKRGAAEYLHEPEGPQIQEQWYGWRPMTYDDLPILGSAPGWKNLVLATGHGMLGVSLSAITGHLIAEIITGRTPSIDITPYSATRFGRSKPRSSI